MVAGIVGLATSTLFLILSATATTAFTPSFLPQNQNRVQCSSNPNRLVSHSPQSSSATTTKTTTTALSMNLFDRFTRVAKSNINNVLKNLEDPEKIMTQALEDMQVCVIYIYVCMCVCVNMLMGIDESYDIFGSKKKSKRVRFRKCWIFCSSRLLSFLLFCFFVSTVISVCLIFYFETQFICL